MEPPSPRPVEPMAPNTSVENIVVSSPASLKRKAVVEEDTPVKVNGEGKENAGVEKRAKVDSTPISISGCVSSPVGPSATPPAIVDSQKRKLLFKQEAYPPPFPVRQMLEFQLYLTDLEGDEKKVTEMPEEHYPLVFCAGLESSCATELLLARQIVKSLSSGFAAQMGSAASSNVIPPETILPLIPKFFTLQHYGFLPSDFASSSSSSVKVPAALQLRAWEAIDPAKYLTTEQISLLDARKAEREKAREEIVRVLDGLDDIEKLELWKGPKEKVPKGDKADKVEKIERGRESSATKTPTRTFEDLPRPDMTRSTREGTATTTGSRRSVSPVKKAKMTPEEEEAARVKKEERDAKKAAREEKKAALAKEMQKKEDSIAKQAQKMSMFFKPKAQPASSPATKESVAGPSTPTVAKPPKKSDFERAFLPFEPRQNVTLAPVNSWSRQRRRRSTSSDMEEVTPKADVSGWTTHDFLAEHLTKHQLKSRRRRALPAGIKSGPVLSTVQELWLAHQEAEDPRKVLNKLKNRDRFPWKTLAFDQQTRPPYCGTWTKRSVAVGPRTPFAQDPTIDYSYDSGDDWQDDEGGEDVDGVDAPDKNDDSADDKDSDEEEGEFDDWLDDSEDAEAGPHPGSMLDVDEDFPVPASTMGQAKLPMKVVKKREPAPKKVVKLTPVWKGPEWESEIGQGTEGMGEYRIQLLNETPVQINPFTYTSADPVQNFTTSFTTSAIGVQMSVKTLRSADPVKPVIATDDSNLGGTTGPAPPAPSSTDAATTPSTAASTSAKPRAPPKVAFPSSHLPELLRLVDGSSKIQSDLISQLKAHFADVTSKAAIEAKIKEVCVREGKAKEKVWRVKPEIWASVDLEPPPATSSGIVVPSTTNDQATFTPRPHEEMEVDDDAPQIMEERRADMPVPIAIDA